MREGGFDMIPLTPFGVIRSKDGISVIDLESGATLWDSTAIPIQKVRGYFEILEHDMMLVYGETPESKRTLVAVDISSGDLRWRHDDHFREKPKTEKIDGIETLFGNQPPLLDTDTTLILHVSKDGPMRLHAATGEILWRADAMRGKEPPVISEAYAPLLLENGVLFVPEKKKLWALEVSTGELIWERDKKFKGHVGQMELTPRGLVVRGVRPPGTDSKIGAPRSFIDLVDPATGESVWPDPYTKLKKESLAPFLITGDSIYHADKERFVALSFEDGTYREVSTFKFEGGEEPRTIEHSEAGFLLVSSQNLLSLDSLGTPKYHHYYPAPGRSLLSKIGSAALFIASMASMAAANDTRANCTGTCFTAEFFYNPFISARHDRGVETDDYAFMYTRASGDAAQEGFSLVRLNKTDGREIGRLWLNERSPEYVIDEVTGTVFVKQGDGKMIAVQFAERERKAIGQ
jgi:outer membrane protein assembly factor BamB